MRSCAAAAVCRRAGLIAALALVTVAAARPAVPTEAGEAPSVFDRDALAAKPLRLYGRLNAGLTRPGPLRPSLPGDTCARPAADTGWGIGSAERSHLGIVGVEPLGSGWNADLALEHSFDVTTGESLGACGVVFDGRATVALSERSFGRVDLGRLEQPAWQLVLQADPWRGNGSVSPAWRYYLSPETGATRSADALSYASPAHHPVRFATQMGRARVGGDAGYRWGSSLAWADGPWLVGAGIQTWGQGSRAAPLVVVHDSGTLRLAAAITLGQFEHQRHTNAFFGASGTLMALGDPRRDTWRIGVNRHRSDVPGLSDDKLGIGWGHRLSSRTEWLAGASVVRLPGGDKRYTAELSVSHSFDRNLRLPQWPR